LSISHKTLVTGGAGFIGSHLVERLLLEDHQVVVVDNLSSGRLENLEGVKENPRLRFHEANVARLHEIREYFKDVEWVFHLAALADIVPSIQQPIPYHEANVDGTIAVLEAARTAGVKRFVYAASSSCYGIPDTFPTPETADIRPMYPYALTKYLGEHYVMHWNKVYKLPCVSLRLFNVYGPRARTSGTYGAVFGVFLAQKLAGKPFTVVGDGTQTRDFTFVTDVVEAFVTAAKSDVDGEIFNIGSSHTYSVNRLVELLGGEVTYVPKRPGEPDCTFADVQKVAGTLGWKPRVSFEAGVQTMLDNMDYWRNAPVWDENSIAEATKDWFTYLGDSNRDTRLSGDGGGS
jgi:UDP-glucose 4-epimerase